MFQQQAQRQQLICTIFISGYKSSTTITDYQVLCPTLVELVNLVAQVCDDRVVLLPDSDHDYHGIGHGDHGNNSNSHYHDDDEDDHCAST